MEENIVCFAFVNMSPVNMHLYMSKADVYYNRIMASSSNINGDTDSTLAVCFRRWISQGIQRIWVTTSQWDVTVRKSDFTLDSSHRTLAFAHHHAEISGYKNFLQILSPLTTNENLASLEWMNFHCEVSHSNCKTLKNCSSNASLEWLMRQTFDMAFIDYNYDIYDAVHIVAHFFQEMFLHTVDNVKGHQFNCLKVVVFLSLSQFLFWTAITRGVAVELPRTSTVLRRLVVTGADITIIAPEFWHPNWPVQEVNVQLLGIGTLSQVKQSARWLECTGPEGQRAKLKPYVANIAMNLWGRDLLKQWNTQINIPPTSETNQLTHVSERNTRRYYSNHWSPAIQIVQEQGRTTVDLPKTPTALPLKWLTDKPVWVQQWPLTTEKLQALEELVQEQLNAQHIEESTSPWNSSVFVIKKKSGKWRMVTDLRAINKVIQPMGSLQSGIPLPTLLPKGWPLIVIDLKDCFFSIPLQEKDRERFAFTVPTYNNSQPVKRYQWRVLPQGMLNSPTLCQYFVQQPLEVIRKKFPKSIIYHYMDDILLTDSNADTLERLFEEVKKILPCWGLQIAPEKIQKGDSVNYLGYKIGLQKIRPQKVQIRRDRLRTLNDFQRLFGDISHLRTITGVKNVELSNLFKTLEGDKDLNSPRELTPEAEKELALVEKKVQDGHVDRVDPKLDCILVILPSRYSPTGILMQREDIILEWIFLPNKQSKKLKTYVEKISDLILKGKLRLRQLAGIDPAEIVVPLTKEEIEKLWAESEPWQRACSNFLGEINSKYPKSDRIELIKRADWILPRIVRETPISGVCTFYTDANKQGKAGYKSEDLSKVVQSPYNSVQKSELYAILLVLMDFSEPLNIVTDSQYAERVVLHIETAEFIPDESELTSLFIQSQDIIRNRKHPLYITHIRSHTGLPGPLAQGNDEIDKLLIGNVLEASEFHKKHHVNSKGLKRDFSITWQQAKEIVRKCPTCSFYNQTLLPAGCNPKGTQRNDIWQMDVFHFAEFGKLKYVHHTIHTYSGFQWATALSSEKADSVIKHLLEVMAIMGIPAQIKTDNAPAYVSGKMKQFLLITI
ncbi:hypothetical protein STEG23_024726 [Scotinomys teguina]